MRTTAATLACLIAATATAQATILVGGPGGAPQIRTALLSASPGDTLLVAPGTYAYFDAGIGVTIRAAIPGTINVEFDPAFAPPSCGFLCAVSEITELSTPIDQVMHIIGIRFVGNTAPASGFGLFRHRVFVLPGTVTFDRCIFEADGIAALEIIGTTYLQDCEIRSLGGTSAAVRVRSAGVSAINCNVIGSPGGGEGISIEGGDFHASGLTVNAGPNAEAIVFSTPPGTAWISDSVLRGGAGRCAIVNQFGSSTSIRLSRTQVIDNATGCATTTAGPQLVGATRSGPLSPGQPFTLSLRSAAGFGLCVLAAPRVDQLDFSPLAEQPVWLQSAGAYSAAALVADANGDASVTWQIPASPSLVDSQLWLQAVTANTQPLQLSPVVGGIVR